MSIFDKILRMSGAIGASMLTAGFFINQCLFVVDGGQRALLFDRISGLKPKIHGEGMNFKIPFLQRAILFEVRTSPKVISAKTGTKDLQTETQRLDYLHQEYHAEGLQSIWPQHLPSTRRSNASGFSSFYC